MAGVRITLACCCAAWGLASLAFASNVGIAFGALLFIAYGAAILLAIWLTMMVAGKVAKKRVPRPWFEPVGIIVVLAMVYVDLPFRARFFISKPFLDRYVREATATGWTDGTHERVGLFTARETQVLGDGLVRIVTTSCMFDHCGLVFSSKGAPPVQRVPTHEQRLTSVTRCVRHSSFLVTRVVIDLPSTQLATRNSQPVTSNE